MVHSDGKAAGSLPMPIVALLDEQYHLIRPEFRGTTKWYELSHDRLVLPILTSNARWRQAREGGEMIASMEERARAWKSAGASASGLLMARELAQVERWRA